MTDAPAASEAPPTRERGASAGLQWLRSRARASDGWFIACATLVGVLCLSVAVPAAWRHSRARPRSYR